MSKEKSTRKKSNFACIARIILGPCTDTLRDVLKNQISLAELKNKFRKFINDSAIYEEGFEIPFINVKEYVRSSENYTDFDISFLYFFLRWVCDISLHGYKWGQYPSDKDRSVSANIERVYRIREKYKTFPKGSLKDSTFEHEWENILNIVKELETNIGSDTVYQDSVKKIRNSSMDTDVENIFIKNLLDHSNRPRIYDMRSFGYPAEIPGMVTEEFVKKSIDIVIQYLEGQTEHLKRKDIPQRQLEHITSESLKKLLGSFKVEFRSADVPGHESFARTILNNEILELETAIQSLSREIVLTNTLDMLDPFTPQVDACVYEVDVVYEGDGDGNGDQFLVIRKGTHPNMLFKRSEDKRIKVMLIRSQFLPVIPSKRLVYKSFKHEINEEEIYLQHEYEDFDDVAKLIAYRLLSSFCSSLESIIYGLTTDLHENMSDEFDKLLTAEEIKEICWNTFKKMTYKSFGQRTTSFRYWSYAFVQFITSKLSEEKLDGADAWKEIQWACRETVEDFKFILSDLEKFQSNELQVDQKKRIKEWHKRYIGETESLLRNNPSIIKYIAGHKEGGQKVVKVFVFNDDENTKRAFTNCCEVPMDTHFEFVKVKRTERNEGEKEKPSKGTQRLKDKAFASENLDRKQLTEIIQKEEDKMYARHSHLIGIRIGNISQVDELEKEQLGIILYCLDKTLIPFGEKPLPNSIKGWPCDVKEDFFMFGRCPYDCRNTILNLTELGCSIGIKSDLSAGSAGFFYEPKYPDNPFGSGFLTASHVAIKQSNMLYASKKQLLQHRLGRKTHIIVHPSMTDGNISNSVGHVVEAFYGNFGDPSTGLDVAAVRNHMDRPEEMEKLPVLTKDDLTPGKCIIVKKTGRTTETTFGQLEGVMISVNKPPDSDFGLPIRLKLVYYVTNMYSDVPFFGSGDSGSGVFVLGEKIDLPLGIAIGTSNEDQCTFVCKIDKVLEDLDIDIVNYKKDNNNTLSITGKKKLRDAKDQSPTF